MPCRQRSFSVLLFILRLVLCLVWLFTGLLIVLLAFPVVTANCRRGLTRHWSRVLLWVCGVKVRVLGPVLRHGPVLWVANHVSWVDIFVLNSVRAAVFVAKSAIRRWPVIGWLVAGSGTIFVERGRRHAIRAVGHQMKARLQRGDVVGLFPEGMTSTGLDVGLFYSSLFDAALQAGVDIQPVALRFFHRGVRSDYVSFVGEQNLLQNMWYLLGTTGIVIEAEFFPVMPNAYCQNLGRSQTAALARQQIQDSVRIC